MVQSTTPRTTTRSGSSVRYRVQSEADDVDVLADLVGRLSLGADNEEPASDKPLGLVQETIVSKKTKQPVTVRRSARLKQA